MPPAKKTPKELGGIQKQHDGWVVFVNIDKVKYVGPVRTKEAQAQKYLIQAKRCNTQEEMKRFVQSLHGGYPASGGRHGSGSASSSATASNRQTSTVQPQTAQSMASSVSVVGPSNQSLTGGCHSAEAKKKRRQESVGGVFPYANGWRVRAKIEGRTCYGPVRREETAARKDLTKARRCKTTQGMSCFLRGLHEEVRQTSAVQPIQLKLDRRLVGRGGAHTRPHSFSLKPQDCSAKSLRGP